MIQKGEVIINPGTVKAIHKLSTPMQRAGMSASRLANLLNEATLEAERQRLRDRSFQRFFLATLTFIYVPVIVYGLFRAYTS